MLDLDKKYISLIQTILNTYVPNQTVLAYGSRTKGTSHEGSDLDLVIVSDKDAITQKQLSALRDAFSESNLPILIDVLDWNTLPDEFKQEIDKEHIVLQAGHPDSG